MRAGVRGSRTSAFRLGDVDDDQTALHSVAGSAFRLRF